MKFDTTSLLFNSVRTRHLMVLDYIKPPGGEVSTKFSSRHFLTIT